MPSVSVNQLAVPILLPFVIRETASVDAKTVWKVKTVTNVNRDTLAWDKTVRTDVCLASAMATRLSATVPKTSMVLESMAEKTM